MLGTFEQLVPFCLCLLAIQLVSANTHRRNTTIIDVTCDTRTLIQTLNHPEQYPVRHLEYWRLNIPAEVLLNLVCSHFHIPRPDNKVKINVLNGAGHPVKPTETFDSGEDVVNQWTYSTGQIWPYDTSVSIKLLGSFRQNHLGTGFSCSVVGQCPLSTTTSTTTTTTMKMAETFVQVKDATTGALLANVAVTLVGESTFSGTTNSQGRVELGSLSVGSMVELTAILDGYSNFTQTFTVSESGGIFINMSPVVVEGEFRAVMSWGSEPSDLDFHNLVFNGTSLNCHVAYYNQVCGHVNLDFDNVRGGDFGPETITWTSTDNFTHLVYVFDFTGGSTSLYESGAKVTFNGPGGAQVVVDVPTHTGGERYWIVACIDGSAGHSSINVLNYLTDSAPNTVCQT